MDNSFSSVMLALEGFIFGLINNPHPTATDFLWNAVVRNMLADHLSHGETGMFI
jgi:hypothetical protein